MSENETIGNRNKTKKDLVFDFVFHLAIFMLGVGAFIILYAVFKVPTWISALVTLFVTAPLVLFSALGFVVFIKDLNHYLTKNCNKEKLKRIDTVSAIVVYTLSVAFLLCAFFLMSSVGKS